MLLTELARRRVLFVGGKGGVGKTTVASGIATALARTGLRVLIASTDPAHSLGHLWQRRLGPAPLRVADTGAGSVDALELDPAATVAAHLATVEQTMLGLLDERLHKAARAHIERAASAPGSHEAAMLESIATLMQSAGEDVDTVVFDTAPTGHTLRLLSLPEQLQGWTQELLRSRDRSERYASAMSGLVSGRSAPQPESRLRQTLRARQTAFSSMQRTITDAASCGFVAVTTAEAMPLAETAALTRELRQLRIALLGTIVNRRSPADSRGLLASRRAVEDRALAAAPIDAAEAPVREIPLLPDDIAGTRAIAGVADLLVAGD